MTETAAPFTAQPSEVSAKRGRGRPRKNPSLDSSLASTSSSKESPLAKRPKLTVALDFVNDYNENSTPSEPFKKRSHKKKSQILALKQDKLNNSNFSSPASSSCSSADSRKKRGRPTKAEAEAKEMAKRKRREKRDLKSTAKLEQHGAGDEATKENIGDKEKEDSIPPPDPMPSSIQSGAEQPTAEPMDVDDSVEDPGISTLVSEVERLMKEPRGKRLAEFNPQELWQLQSQVLQRPTHLYRRTKRPPAANPLEEVTAQLKMALLEKNPQAGRYYTIEYFNYTNPLGHESGSSFVESWLAVVNGDKFVVEAIGCGFVDSKQGSRTLCHEHFLSNELMEQASFYLVVAMKQEVVQSARGTRRKVCCGGPTFIEERRYFGVRALTLVKHEKVEITWGNSGVVMIPSDDPHMPELNDGWLNSLTFIEELHSLCKIRSRSPCLTLLFGLSDDYTGRRFDTPVKNAVMRLEQFGVLAKSDSVCEESREVICFVFENGDEKENDTEESSNLVLFTSTLPSTVKFSYKCPWNGRKFTSLHSLFRFLRRTSEIFAIDLPQVQDGAAVFTLRRREERQPLRVFQEFARFRIRSKKEERKTVGDPGTMSVDDVNLPFSMPKRIPVHCGSRIIGYRSAANSDWAITKMKMALDEYIDVSPETLEMGVLFNEFISTRDELPFNRSIWRQHLLSFADAKGEEIYRSKLVKQWLLFLVLFRQRQLLTPTEVFNLIMALKKFERPPQTSSKC